MEPPKWYTKKEVKEWFKRRGIHHSPKEIQMFEVLFSPCKGILSAQWLYTTIPTRHVPTRRYFKKHLKKDGKNEDDNQKIQPTHNHV